MTSFVNIKYSTQHPGVARVESAIDAAKQLRQGFSGTRGLATLLLSAMAAAVMVVAYQVMDSVTEGHLLVMWMALWAVAFAALALFAGTARNLAARLKAGLDSWSRSLAEARADQRLWPRPMPASWPTCRPPCCVKTSRPKRREPWKRNMTTCASSPHRFVRQSVH